MQEDTGMKSSRFYGLQSLEGSEMAKLIWQHPWAATSLGAMDGWPDNLLTVLSVLLTSRFPMFLFWGPELICFYNDAYRPSLGTDGKHPFALGKSAREVWPEIWDEIKPLLLQVMQDAQPTWNEDRLFRMFRNGQMEDVYWTFSNSPVYNANGRVDGILVTCIETTLTVKTVRKLQVSEQRFQNLVRQSLFGIIVVLGEEKQVAIVNDFYASMIGRSVAELVGKPLFEVIPETRPYFEHVIEQVRMTGNSVYLFDEPYFVLVNGHRKEGYANLVYQSYREDDGTLSGVIVMCQDVTDQVLAKQRTELAEERARLAIQTTGLGVYEIDLFNGHLEGDARFYEILGFSEPAGWDEVLAHFHPDDRAIRDQAMNEAYDTGVLAYQVRVLQPDHTYRWVSCTGKMVFDTRRYATRLIGVAQDVTDQKLSSQELEKKVQERTMELAESNVQLQQTNAELNQFVYIASHDLQEPLRKVRTFIDLMETGMASVPENTKAYIDKINHSTERMQNLILDLLQFSQLMPNGRWGLVDLNSILREVAGDLDLLTAQKKGEIIWNPLPVLEAIPLQMSQLFSNLFSNSLKFAQEGKKPLITVTSRVLSPGEVAGNELLVQHKTYHRIVVKDNGIGFSQEYAERIFVIFQRLHGRSEYAGTGIGLAICRKIVQNHKGVIYAESTPGEGASFTIILPEVQ